MCIDNEQFSSTIQNKIPIKILNRTENIISSKCTPIPGSLLTIVCGDHRLLSKIPDLDSTGKEYIDSH